MLSLIFFKHVRLLDLSFQVLLCFSACLFSGLGFRHVCVRILLYAHTGSKYVYAYNWPAYAGLCMCAHTTGLHTQAYVCAHILVPRNLNFDFPVSFALFVLPKMPLF